MHTFPTMHGPMSDLYPTRLLSHLDQFLALAFASLTFQESFGAQLITLSHLGSRGNLAGSTLADPYETRDWRVSRDFTLILLHVARPRLWR